MTRPVAKTRQEFLGDLLIPFSYSTTFPSGQEGEMLLRIAARIRVYYRAFVSLQADRHLCEQQQLHNSGKPKVKLIVKAFTTPRYIPDQAMFLPVTLRI